jgi:four helix bundle protein
LSKISIATKEARETRYWILLLDKSQLVALDLKEYKNEIEQIINILCAILKTLKSKNIISTTT